MMVVFEPLVISLVVAANFAFDHANRKNLYGEVESKNDIFNDIDEDPKDIEVKEEVVKAPEDWKVVDEKPVEIKVERVLQNAPSKVRAKLSNGNTEWVDKKDIDDDNIIRYL